MEACGRADGRNWSTRGRTPSSDITGGERHDASLARRRQLGALGLTLNDVNEMLLWVASDDQKCHVQLRVRGPSAGFNGRGWLRGPRGVESEIRPGFASRDQQKESPVGHGPPQKFHQWTRARPKLPCRQNATAKTPLCDRKNCADGHAALEAPPNDTPCRHLKPRRARCNVHSTLLAGTRPSRRHNCICTGICCNWILCLVELDVRATSSISRWHTAELQPALQRIEAATPQSLYE
jgi:hypothetical protein